METSDQQNLVELLFLALYQDGHLSIDEDSMLQKALNALGWQLEETTGPSVGQAFAAVREANSSDEKKDLFLRERVASLRGEGHSFLAFEWLGKVLASDGLDPREEHFLEQARKLLFD